MWLFIALIVVPLIEIALFIEVGGLIGLWPTIAIVILTALIGAALLRRQGLAVLTDLERRVRAAEDPRGPILHGLLILVSGIVLLTPGFFTDTIGFLLLVPPVRDWLIRTIGRRIVVAGMAARARQGPDEPRPAREATIETDYEDVTDRSKPRRGADRSSGWTRPD